MEFLNQFFPSKRDLDVSRSSCHTVTNHLPCDKFTVGLQQYQPSFFHKVSSQILCNILKTTKLNMFNRVYRQPIQIIRVFKTFEIDFQCARLPINI